MKSIMVNIDGVMVEKKVIKIHRDETNLMVHKITHRLFTAMIVKISENRFALVK